MPDDPSCSVLAEAGRINLGFAPGHVLPDYCGAHQSVKILAVTKRMPGMRADNAISRWRVDGLEIFDDKERV